MPTTEDDDGSVVGGRHQSDLLDVQVFIMLRLADTLSEGGCLSTISMTIWMIILTLAALEVQLNRKNV